MKQLVLPLALILLLLVSCTKHHKDAPVSRLVFTVAYSVDGVALIKDTMNYTNDAGNLYSVTRLEYFISDIVLHQANGNDFHSPLIQYMNAFTPGANQIILYQVPFGNYESMTMNIGLKPSLNISNSLPNTAENINMEWPDNMGGGYHFLKMEGYVNTPGGDKGYAVHLGSDTALVTCNMIRNLDVQQATMQVALTMNLNEWYRSPTLYDFLVDGNNTMGNAVLMHRIAQNGYNVFSLY